ncbi:hypothetical protein E8E13_002725 [Curvularia kusanoi]|uniref:Uncharacterized protein n=1 Tax=Curvularia kusanoi TaxID=90978 RepID=A0A9P4T453_CURKU|nr:hypothetical protein E8E13_002725 [Curvularia kusanoi]
MPSCHIERCGTWVSEKDKDDDNTLTKSSSVTFMSLPPADNFGPLERHDAVPVGDRKPMRIMGKLLLFQMGGKNKYTGDFYLGGYDFIRGGSEMGASIRAYFPDTIQKEVSLYCVLLRTEQLMALGGCNDGYYEDYDPRFLKRFGLVLAPIQDEEGVYRRTGVFEERLYGVKGEDNFRSSPWDDLRENREIIII